MPTKPTVKPQWAEDDVIDPTSGQNNVAEPPPDKKTDGIDFEEIIPRQWQNWLQRIIYRWIDWLDGTTIPLTLSGDTTNEQLADGTGHTHEVAKATTTVAGVVEKSTSAENISGVGIDKFPDVSGVSEIIGAILPITGYAINLPVAAHTGQSLDVSGQDTQPTGFSISPDGLTLLMVGKANDSIYQYNMSEAYNLSTAVYSGNSLLISGQDTNANGMFVKPDGTMLFIVGATNEFIFAYDISTPWDISTASYSGNSFDISPEGGTQSSLIFSPDGDKMMISVVTSVNEYDLSTPWDITTASFVQASAALSHNANGAWFSDDGKKMIAVNPADDDLFEFLLPVAWDVSEINYFGVTRVLETELGFTSPNLLFFDEGGKRMFIGDNVSLDIKSFASSFYQPEF